MGRVSVPRSTSKRYAGTGAKLPCQRRAIGCGADLAAVDFYDDVAGLEPGLRKHGAVALGRHGKAGRAAVFGARGKADAACYGFSGQRPGLHDGQRLTSRCGGGHRGITHRFGRDRLVDEQALARSAALQHDVVEQHLHQLDARRDLFAHRIAALDAI